MKNPIIFGECMNSFSAEYGRSQLPTHGVSPDLLTRVIIGWITLPNLGGQTAYHDQPRYPLIANDTGPSCNFCHISRIYLSSPWIPKPQRYPYPTNMASREVSRCHH